MIHIQTCARHNAQSREAKVLPLCLRDFCISRKSAIYSSACFSLGSFAAPTQTRKSPAHLKQIMLTDETKSVNIGTEEPLFFQSSVCNFVIFLCCCCHTRKSIASPLSAIEQPILIEADVCTYMELEKYIYFALGKTDASHTLRHIRLKEQQGGRREGVRRGRRKTGRSWGKKRGGKGGGRREWGGSGRVWEGCLVLDDTNEKATIICPSSQWRARCSSLEQHCSSPSASLDGRGQLRAPHSGSIYTSVRAREDCRGQRGTINVI